MPKHNETFPEPYRYALLDYARYHAYWMCVFASGGGIASAGREVNEFVRIDSRWLIGVRDVDSQDRWGISPKPGTGTQYLFLHNLMNGRQTF